MTELWNLRQTNLFAGLKPKTMNKVLDILQVRHVERGAYVFSPGDSCNRLYFLHHGRVKTFVLSEQGQEKIMHMFYSGDAFGGLLMGVAHDELPWAQALDDVVISYMDETAFKRFMQAFPDLCMNIFRYMADHHAEDMRRLAMVKMTQLKQINLYVCSDCQACDRAATFLRGWVNGRHNFQQIADVLPTYLEGI